MEIYVFSFILKISGTNFVTILLYYMYHFFSCRRNCSVILKIVTNKWMFELHIKSTQYMLVYFFFIYTNTEICSRLMVFNLFLLPQYVLGLQLITKVI